MKLPQSPVGGPTGIAQKEHIPVDWISYEYWNVNVIKTFKPEDVVLGQTSPLTVALYS